MAEAARNLTPSTNTGGSFSFPANDNASPRRQTQMQDALRLRSNQLSDRLLDQHTSNDNGEAMDPFEEVSGSDIVSDSSLPSDSSMEADGKPILALKPRSYTQGQEATSEEREKERQHSMLETQYQFTEPGKALPEESIPSQEERSTTAPRSIERNIEEEPRPSETARALALQQTVARERQQEQQEQSTVSDRLKDIPKAERTLEDVRRIRKVYASLMKAIQAFTAGAIFPILALIIAIHVEAFNIILLKIDLPEPLGTTLALLGINLSYDKTKGMGVYEIAIVSVTVLFDILFFLAMIPNLIVIMIDIILILSIFGDLIIPGVL